MKYKVQVKDIWLVENSLFVVEAVDNHRAYTLINCTIDLEALEKLVYRKGVVNELEDYL